MEQNEIIGPRPAAGWNEAQVERLIALWGAGLSTAKIAAALGPAFTRNAVVGKLFRLGLRRTDEQRHDAQAQGARQTRAKQRRCEGREPGPTMIPAGPLPETPCAVRPRMAPLTSLGGRSCRWPYTTDDGPLFCGHPAKAESAYCPDHHAVAYFAVLPPLTVEALLVREPVRPRRVGGGR